MDCPECGGALAAYVLDGREAAVCERCDWVGIEAEHRGEPRSAESWGDALGRFYDRHAETERRTADLPTVAAVGDERETAGTEPADEEPADADTDDAVTAPVEDAVAGGDENESAVTGLIEEAEPDGKDADDADGTTD
jgi:hypothetical protein